MWLGARIEGEGSDNRVVALPFNFHGQRGARRGEVAQGEAEGNGAAHGWRMG